MVYEWAERLAVVSPAGRCGRRHRLFRARTRACAAAHAPTVSKNSEGIEDVQVRACLHEEEQNGGHIHEKVAGLVRQELTEGGMAVWWGSVGRQ